ncbi:hypothetical protein AVEN_156595-1 [Araneus ventricosus]|uniref:Uncharacterized protein n=1 Tax=Araneus ventricosus TaxID=182803 RepID=A0A4Y2EUG8_ARAVE|nr:hypothetical protein AVEN_156595-1 [Araneus ventricosus]
MTCGPRSENLVTKTPSFGREKVVIVSRSKGETLPSQPGYQNRPYRKQRSYTTIYMGVERKYQALIADTEDGKTAWDTLKANFEPSSRARLASLVDDFFNSRFDDNEGVRVLVLREETSLLFPLLTCGK